jgi:hypothetical protein
MATIFQQPLPLVLTSEHQWQVNCLLQYRVGVRRQPEYLAEWTASILTTEELNQVYDGQPLWSQATNLQPLATYGPSRLRSYFVRWRPTWVRIEDLEHCVMLLHEFWTASTGSVQS